MKMQQCIINGCRQKTFNSEPLCYYHNKQRLGLIDSTDTYYIKSNIELDCVLGKKEPNWDLALQELPRIKRICNAVVKWSRFPIQELIQESLIVVAVTPIKGFKFKKYFNILIEGTLKNFVAEFKNVVSYYWKPFFKSFNTQIMDGTIDTFSDSDNLEDVIIEKEKHKYTQDYIKQFRKQLNKQERFIFDHRIYTKNQIPLRILEQKLKIGKSSIQRWEQDIKDRMKDISND